MKVSELIDGLKKALAQYGDLEVGMQDAEYMYFQPVVVVCLVARSNEIHYEDDLGEQFVGLTFDSLPLKDGYPHRAAEPTLLAGQPRQE